MLHFHFWLRVDHPYFPCLLAEAMARPGLAQATPSRTGLGGKTGPCPGDSKTGYWRAVLARSETCRARHDIRV